MNGINFNKPVRTHSCFEIILSTKWKPQREITFWSDRVVQIFFICSFLSSKVSLIFCKRSEKYQYDPHVKIAQVSLWMKESTRLQKKPSIGCFGHHCSSDTFSLSLYAPFLWTGHNPWKFCLGIHVHPTPSLWVFMHHSFGLGITQVEVLFDHHPTPSLWVFMHHSYGLGFNRNFCLVICTRFQFLVFSLCQTRQMFFLHFNHFFGFWQKQTRLFDPDVQINWWFVASFLCAVPKILWKIN